ncbi:hypothetical protein EW145_g8019, partial [Phellinidium pouzarii]
CVNPSADAGRYDDRRIARQSYGVPVSVDKPTDKELSQSLAAEPTGLLSTTATRDTANTNTGETSIKEITD